MAILGRAAQRIFQSASLRAVNFWRVRLLPDRVVGEGGSPRDREVSRSLTLVSLKYATR